MAKDTFYFQHDYNPRSDTKIIELLCTHGMLGYGIYWAIIEDLYNNNNSMSTNYKSLAFTYRVKEQIVKSIVNDFQLFTVSELTFCSKSVERRLDMRNEKSNKARESAQKRWETANAMQPQCERIQGTMPTQCDSNAIKERKGKEIKEKEITRILTHSFCEPEFSELWQRWCKYRKEQHKLFYKSADSEQTAVNQLSKLSGNNIQTATDIIEQSIANTWQGLFELKGLQPAKPAPPKPNELRWNDFATDEEYTQYCNQNGIIPKYKSNG